MARRPEHPENGSGTGHIKFRVIEFEIDGGNATLAEGMKALTTALSKSPVTTTPAPQKALPTGTRATTATSSVATGSDADSSGEQETEQDVSELPEDETPENANIPARPKRAPSSPRTPNVLSDIDLNTGKVSLKEFVAQKNPPDIYATYATLAVWYKENHGLDEVNDDRIYTAYKFLDKVPPNDVGQVLRNLKANKKWFDKGQAAYKINIVGMNKVQAGFN